MALTHTDVWAQSTTGSIQGTVKDGAGAPVPGANVKAHDATTNLTQTAATGEDGVFVVPQLPPGSYTITVEKIGFRKFTKTGVILSAADRLSAGTFTLDVGEVSEEITVNADAGQLQIQSESANAPRSSPARRFAIWRSTGATCSI